jgi:ribosomal protein S18 acetylase RimI-like enzyme
MSDIKVRSMYAVDLPRVLTIERMCFGAPLDNVRTLEHYVAPELGMTYLHVNYPTNVGLVAELGGNVVGFMLFQIVWSRGTATVLRLAVLSPYRRRGLASRLLDSMRSGVDWRGEVTAFQIWSYSSTCPSAT